MGNPIIASADAQRVCTLGGIEQKRFSGKLIVLRDLEKTLDLALADVTKAADDENFWKNWEIGAKIIQVACDLTIAVLEEGSEKVGAGMAGKTVSILYDVSKLLVDSLNGDMNVQKAFIFNGNVKLDGFAEILSSRGSAYGKAVSRAKVLGNLTYDLYDYWTGGGKETFTQKSSLFGARQTAQAQLIKIRRQIAETSEALSACGL